MELANHQRILLGLIKSNYKLRPEDDSYFHKVSQSKDLVEARGNIFLWRVYVLERVCVLTFALLRQRNLLEQELDAFIRQHNISPFRETQPPDFLEALSSHDDQLIASVAQFEFYLWKVKQGDLGRYTVSWSVEPHTVLHDLAKNIPIDVESIPKGDYEILISRDLPRLFQIDRPVAKTNRAKLAIYKLRQIVSQSRDKVRKVMGGFASIATNKS